MSSKSDLILYEKKNGIATITMDRPKKRNAMIPSMIIDMIDYLEEARRDHEVRAIVVRGGGCVYLLPRFVGLGKATELLLLGETILADEAHKLGLVTKIFPGKELEAKTYEFAARLAKGPTAAMGAIKNARNQGLAFDPVKGVEQQILCNVELMFHQDAREGPKAFLEKRDPKFTGDWIDLQYDPFEPWDTSK